MYDHATQADYADEPPRREDDCDVCFEPWELRFEWDYTDREQYCLRHILSPIDNQPGKVLLDYMPDCQQLTHRVLSHLDGSVVREVRHTNLRLLSTILTGRSGRWTLKAPLRSRRAFMQLWPCSTLLATVHGCALVSAASAQPALASSAAVRPAEWMTAPAPSSSTSTWWLASAILHEAVHQDQANRGEPPSGVMAEYAASTVQQQWLDRVGFRLDVFRTRSVLCADFPDECRG